MATTAYGICLVISVLVVLWMATKDYGNIDMYFWTIVCIVPLVLLGYWLKTQVTSPEAAMITFCFIYLDSTVILVVGIFLMVRAVGMTVPAWMKLTGYGTAFIHLFIVWNSAYNGMYFKTINLIDSPDGTITKMTAGPLRGIHYFYIAVIFALIMWIMIEGNFRKKAYSKRAFRGYSLIMLFGVLVYITEVVIDIEYSLLPFFYTAADVLVALKYDRVHSHDIACIVSEKQKDIDQSVESKGWIMPADETLGDDIDENMRVGFVAFDMKRRFLSCNHYVFTFWEELKDQTVDEFLPKDSEVRRIFYSMIDAYEKRNEQSHRWTVGDRTCVCEISHFSISKRGAMMGYFFEVRDVTNEQKLIDRITATNSNLEELVTEKTANIRKIQDKIVVGMANMIENRDNTTGGHVKRTSDIIRIIIDEIVRQGTFDLDPEFANDVVRAAPMHDLGKLTIEDAILNKKDKLTDEEYAIMKTHAAKSGETVKILLSGVEEEHFVKVAYHVARYHHERWDGRGYPDHLVGSMIPVEARIMAVADVYDALACKRSYKAAMAPELVAKIILEGMGTQFDPALKPVFLGCQAKLEAYYRK